jgi:hypothetical protein
MKWPPLFVLLCTLVAAPSLGAAEKFELRDGDRVVFLGNTLIERENSHGYWELMLTLAWPERNVTFRNLGWSGDTVWGESRAGFGTQADGFKALTSQVNEAKPTVIFVGYGNVEAFAGDASLPKFREGFGQLLDVLEATKARIVVLGPTLQSGKMTPNPHWEAYNKNAAAYSAAMQEIAAKRGHRFVDFTRSTSQESYQQDGLLGLTEDGNTVGALGYLYLLDDITASLELSIDEELAGEQLERDDGTTPPLLTHIRKKNELFFHRWRPQNETYLFGFRKHEQGNNAKEVFEFDPLVAAEEKKITEARHEIAAGLKNAGGNK